MSKSKPDTWQYDQLTEEEEAALQKERYLPCAICGEPATARVSESRSRFRRGPNVRIAHERYCTTCLEKANATALRRYEKTLDKDDDPYWKQWKIAHKWARETRAKILNMQNYKHLAKRETAE